MKLISVDSTEDPVACQIGVFEDRTGRETKVLFRSLDPVSLPDNYDHFFIVGALAAFLRNEPYEHLGSVCGKLYANFHLVMQQWSGWWKYQPIKIEAAQVAADRAATRTDAMGCLMSGGVDSLFTALTKSDEISAFVHLDHCRSEQAGSAINRPHTGLESFAKGLGRSLYRIETNVMLAFPEIEDAWSSLSHGACMASVGHFLSGELTTLCISASFADNQMRPWGSHPMTDQWLSSDLLQFKHVGTDFNRFEKHKVIAENPAYLEFLSVCEHGPQSGEHINCSNCQKCLRSMITLDLLDIEPALAPTIDWSSYTPEKLKQFLLRGHVNTSELLAYAEEIDREDVASVLRSVIAYSENYRWIVDLELWFRRRFNWLLKYKRTLKRIRTAIYTTMNIRPRRVSTQEKKRDQEYT